MRRRTFWPILAFAVVLHHSLLPRRSGSGLLSQVHAAHSRRRVVVLRSASPPPRYDRSVTTFDPSGRLLQVEYGMEASRRGSAFLAAAVGGADRGGLSSGAVVVVTESSAHEAGPLHYAHSNKVHRLAPHVLLITAGLSGDARALASALRSFSQGHALSFGEPPTVEQVARQAAQLQHELTRAGGARPLGCTAVVVGVDPGGRRARLFRTDPGGAVDECRFAAGGRHDASILAAVGRQFEDIWGGDGGAGGGERAEAANATEAAARLVQAFASGCNPPADDKELVVDVWTVHPAPGRRGDLQATCYWNVTATDPGTFLDAFAAAEHARGVDRPRREVIGTVDRELAD